MIHATYVKVEEWLKDKCSRVYGDYGVDITMLGKPIISDCIIQMMTMWSEHDEM